MTYLNCKIVRKRNIPELACVVTEKCSFTIHNNFFLWLCPERKIIVSLLKPGIGVLLSNWFVQCYEPCELVIA